MSRRVISFFSLCLGVALAVTPLLAAEETALEFRAVVAEASLIVRGRITDVRAMEVPDRGVETVATLAVDAVLKGTTDGFVSFRLPGGQIGRYRTVMEGAPTVAVNETAVIFLKRDPNNAWRPVGLGSGVFAVHADLASGQPVVYAPVLLNRTASAGPVVRGDARRQTLGVQDFESLVSVVVAGAAGLKSGAPR
jgi:hypothetical protein